jgi:uncharacterized protein (DUF486 family)
MTTNAYNDLSKLTNIYKTILPLSTFPWVMLAAASVAQFFAWYGGKYLFPKARLMKRIILLWIIAIIEFTILIPAIGASTEILGYSESFLSITFLAFHLVVFFILNRFTIKAEFNKKHAFAFILMISAVLIAANAK